MLVKIYRCIGITTLTGEVSRASDNMATMATAFFSAIRILSLVTLLKVSVTLSCLSDFDVLEFHVDASGSFSSSITHGVKTQIRRSVGVYRRSRSAGGQNG